LVVQLGAATEELNRSTATISAIERGGLAAAAQIRQCIGNARARDRTREYSLGCRCRPEWVLLMTDYWLL
jgi:hypothetical protein